MNLDDYDLNGINNYNYELFDTDYIKFLLIGTIIYLIVYLVIYIIKCISMWKLFKKSGVKEIYSVIPIYNTYLLYEISGLEGWYIFLMFIPIIGLLIISIFNIICKFKLSKSFGKDSAFAIGLILVPAIFLPVLAFGKSEYIGPNGIKKDENIN